MRRLGSRIRVVWLITACLAVMAAPRLVRAYYPVIAVPAYIDQLPRTPQPLADFRAPEPFLTPKRTAPDGGSSILKVFLSERSLLDDEPAIAPALGVRPPKNETVVQSAPVGLSFALPEAMPAEVADAVEVVLGKKSPPPRSPHRTPIDVAEAPPAAVRNAIEVLKSSVKKSGPTLVEEMPFDPDRDAKLAAVTKQISVLNDSIRVGEPETLAALVVGSAVPLTGELDPPTDAKTAIANAAAKLLGQIPETPTRLPEALPITNLPATPTVAPATCTNCGRGYHARPLHKLGEFSDSIGRCNSCSGGWSCSPGRTPCQPCEAHDGPLGRLFCNFYECLCCPDPCYEGRWQQVANASLFVDGARPMTQTEVRWNASRGGIFPDRSEYIWARADGRGKGPRPPAGRIGEGQFDFDDLVLITETAKDKLSAIIELPYRSVSPDTYAHGSGFGDMAIGTKTLLFDCELLQVSMQMKTYLPVGNFLKGVGNGHVSLEPSLLFALKLNCDTYLQGQISEWIPIGGDPIYSGSVLHSHFSLNHVVHRFGPDIPVVGTFETNTFSFQDGAYTDNTNGAFQKSSGTTYVSVGPGIRLFFCDKLDIGFGSAIAVTGDHFSREYYRTSIRMRF